VQNAIRKNVLVTGGAGFLGSHLCERLLSLGHEVLCVDNFFTGSKENIVALADNHYFELLRHDVTMPLYVEADAIYNLACPASPIHYQRDPVQTTKVSVHGAINMLGLAKRLGVPIFQASTSEIYGDPEIHPQPESYRGSVNTIDPRTCYDEGKRCAETLFFDYRRQHGLPIKVARIFNTYGPRMHPADGRVVSNFIMQALRNEPITIYGNGQQTRSFCFVDDLVDGFLALMDTHADFTRSANLENPSEFTIFDSFRGVDVRRIFLKRAPGITKHYRSYILAYPSAFSTLRLPACNLVFSSSSSFAKGVRAGAPRGGPRVLTPRPGEVPADVRQTGLLSGSLPPDRVQESRLGSRVLQPHRA